MKTTMIQFRSLANDSNELEGRTTLPPGAELTLAQYVAHLLDDTQQCTRSMVEVPAMPASGRGSERTTLRVRGA